MGSGIGGLLLLIGVMVQLHKANDPVYAGKSLSTHLEAFDHCKMGRFEHLDELTEPHVSYIYYNRQDYDLANQAVDQVGSQALPLLVQMLQTKDSRWGLWNSRLGRWIETVRIKHRWHWLSSRQYRGEYMRLRGLIALNRLGPKAAPAIPRLLEIIKDPHCPLEVVLALKAINPDWAPEMLSLTNALRIPFNMNSSKYGCWPQLTSLLFLASFGTNAAAATPSLLACLGSNDEEIRAAAAVGLAKMGAPAGQVVPMVVKNLPQTNPPAMSGGMVNGGSIIATFFSPRSWPNRQPILRNLRALEAYGGQAQQALPILTNLQEHPSMIIQDVARDTASKIRAGAGSAAP